MDILELTIVALAGFLSAVIKNGVGVGAGVFLLPVLSLAFPAKAALGIGAPLMLGSDLLGLRNYWREWVGTRELLRLLIPAVPGLVAGTLLIPIIPGHIFRAGVGIFGMSYALCLLLPHWRPVVLLKHLLPQQTPQAKSRSAFFYGAFGGLATVMAHAGGLVWSIYLMSTQTDRRVFVGTMILLFASTNLYKTVAYMQIGILTPHLLLMTIMTLPALYVGSWLGNILNKKVDRELFRKVVLIVIFVVSACLFR